jgi:nucleotide-binding universal stress UspA family protein
MKDLHISRIVLPTDFSETGLLAIEHGGNMARLFAAELHLLHINEPVRYPFPPPEPILRFSNEEEIDEMVSKRMEDIAADIVKRFGVKVITATGEGRIAFEIAEYAEEKEADLIVMGTHGANGYEEFFLGSNAERVVYRANCPVITIQAHAHKLGFSNIVLPIDSTLHSRQKVEYAIMLAKPFKATLHLLGLIESEDDDAGKFDIKMEAVEEAVKKAGVPYIKKIIKDVNDAAEALVYSKSVNADLIIIMTDHESELPGAFLGAVAKKIVNHSLIPVMSIRPHTGLMVSTNPAGDPGYEN